MKKTALILVVVLLFSFTQGFAKTGDIAGRIYSTDIKAFINGMEVPSYNIGGKTAVVIEDILKTPAAYAYYNNIRTLKVFSMSPLFLITGSSEATDTPGKVKGNIYQTDIKTLFYGKEVLSYNIGGKTAVVIEDLGSDKVFSHIGGRYFWNEEARTISLEFLYENAGGSILTDNHADMTITINDDLTQGVVTFKDDPFLTGSTSTIITWPKWFDERTNKDINAIIPLVSENNEEVLGYHFYISDLTDDWDGFTAFTYFYDHKLEADLKNIERVSLSREDIIVHYENNRLGNTIKRFDTDGYSFLYMSAGTPHGGTQYLLLVNNDGTWHDYSRDFNSVSLWGTKNFENVIIDEENEKVFLHYDIDYVIDLKTGELKSL